LLTPRTLGPLRDAARAHGGSLARLLTDGDRDPVLAAVLAELTGSRPTVLVLDDVHWADDATLDVLRYIGRRVGELAAVSRSASPIHRRRLEGPANESHRGYPCAAAPASAVRATNRNRSPR
jgi:hypothetical protein